MKILKPIIAKNIQFYRKKNNLSQKELAKKLNIKHNTISSWENCTNSVDIDSLFALCSIFGISINDIIIDNGAENVSQMDGINNSSEEMKNRIIELRKQLKLTQKAFGEPLNLSRATIANLETGTRNITSRTIADICRVYNVNPEWLKDGNEEMFEVKQNTDVELSALTAQLIKSGDEWTKTCIVNFLKLSPQNREIFKDFLNTIVHTSDSNPQLK